MSGHSHWSTIKHKKAANDQERGRVFAKVSREIILAISLGGGPNPDKNLRLRAAMETAKEVNMPKSNINRLLERAIQKVEQVTEVVYEALGQNDISYIIKTATDNPRRTQTDLKVTLDKNGGKLVAKGSVMYNYDLCGMFTVKDKSETEVLEIIEAIEAFDFVNDNNSWYIFIEYNQLSKAWQKVKELGIDRAPELIYKAKNLVKLLDKDAQKALKLAEKLEALEDVQAIFMNLDYSL